MDIEDLFHMHRRRSLTDLMDSQWGEQVEAERIDVSAVIEELAYTKSMEELKAEVNMLDRAIESKFSTKNIINENLKNSNNNNSNSEQLSRPRFQNRRHTQPSFKYDVGKEQTKRMHPGHSPKKRNSLPPIINDNFDVHCATKLAWAPFTVDNNNVRLPKLKQRFPSFSVSNGLYLNRSPYVIDEEPSDDCEIQLKVSASSEFSRVMLDFRDLKLT